MYSLKRGQSRRVSESESRSPKIPVFKVRSEDTRSGILSASSSFSTPCSATKTHFSVFTYLFPRVCHINGDAMYCFLFYGIGILGLLINMECNAETQLIAGTVLNSTSTTVVMLNLEFLPSVFIFLCRN